MEAQRTISMFVVTTIIAYYALVFEQSIKIPYVFLVPIAILLPFAYKELDHKIAISYIVGYQIVCLENVKDPQHNFTWETDWFVFRNKGYNKKLGKIVTLLIDCEFVIISLVSYSLYILYFYFYTFVKDNIFCITNILGFIFAIIFLVFIVAIMKVTREYNTYTNSTEYYIKQWLEYMLKEGRIDIQIYKERLKELKIEE